LPIPPEETVIAEAAVEVTQGTVAALDLATDTGHVVRAVLRTVVGLGHAEDLTADHAVITPEAALANTTVGARTLTKKQKL